MSVNQLQSEITTLQRQKMVAMQAYYSGNFQQGGYASKEAAYAAFNAYQDQLIAQKTSQLRALQNQNPPAPVVSNSKPVSPMPSEPGSSNYFVQGNYVQHGATVTEVESGKVVGVVGKDKLSLESGKQYSVSPPGSNPSALELAKVQSEAQAIYNKNLARGGTSLPGGNIETDLARQNQPVALLNPIQKQEFAEWKQEKVTKGVTNLGLTMAVGLIPFAGPATGLASVSGIVAGEVISVGIEQGFKLVQGGGALTMDEALGAAAFGGVFAVGSGALFKGVSLAGRTLGVGVPAGAKGTAVSVMGRASLNAALGGGVSYGLSGGNPEAAVQGAAFGAIFSLGGEAIARSPVRLALEKPGFTQGRMLVLYSSRSPEPRILISSLGDNAKVYLGTPKVSPKVYTSQTPDFNVNYESPFRSPADVKIYEKALKITGQPMAEQEIFSGGKKLVYAAHKTKIPKKDIPKQLSIETERDPFIGKAAAETLKLSEFSDAEFYGSSSVHSVFSEFRKGGDVDVQGFKSQEQANSFAVKLAKNANLLSGTNDYIVIKGNVYRGNVQLTDLHFENQPLSRGNASGASSTFGLDRKAPLLIEKVKVMNPTEATVTKGSSALTPREFTALSSEEAAKFRADNPAAFQRITELPAIVEYQVKMGKDLGVGKVYYGSAPAAYRAKDVTDFLATSKILNKRYWGGKQTGNIDRLVELYTEKGFTSKEKVNLAAGAMSESDVLANAAKFSASLPKPKTSRVLSVSVNVVRSPERRSEQSNFSKGSAWLKEGSAYLSPYFTSKSIGSLPKVSPSKSIINDYPFVDVSYNYPTSSYSPSPNSPEPYSPKPPPPSSPSYPSKYPSGGKDSPAKNYPLFTSLPGGGGERSGGSANERRFWGRRTHAIPLPKQVKKQVLGGKSSLKVRSLVSTSNALTKIKKRGKKKRGM